MTLKQWFQLSLDVLYGLLFVYQFGTGGHTQKTWPVQWISIATRLGHPDHPGHIFPGSTRSDQLYKISGSGPDFA